MKANAIMLGALLLFMGCTNVGFEKPVSVAAATTPPGTAGAEPTGGTSGGTTGGTSGSTTGETTGIAVPPTDSCSQQNLVNLYNTSVTQQYPTQDDIARACVDVNSYEANIGLTATNTFGVTRFQVTCASRWCASYTGDASAVGVIKSAIVFNGTISLSARVNVECRSNITQPAGACSTIVNNNPPIITKVIMFGQGAASCSACGCDGGAVSPHWYNGVGDLINCGTSYCSGLGQGYLWGVLSEVSPTGYAIRCSRAKF